MTTGGWIIMSLALLFVWGLTIWCYKTVLSQPPEEDLTEPPVGMGP
ncbi:MAG TPA: hypothetical protein VFN96_07965 [Gemmatimonadales bacterium]|nr:hypothetical protein [Gemmatimonadales bacterium]